MFRTVPGVCALVSAVILSCSCTGQQAGGRTSATDRIASPPICSAPISLVRVDSGKAAVIGPLYFEAFGSDQQVAILSEYQEGVPTKVPIKPRVNLAKPVILAGERCSDGRALRFWYRGDLPWKPPVSPSTLSSTGDVKAVLAPVPLSDPSNPTAYTGYFFFTSAGRWLITVSQSDGGSDSAVFQAGD